MKTTSLPDTVHNWIDGIETAAAGGALFDKRSPATGERLCRAARSRAADVEDAVQAAQRAYPAWSGMPPVQRGDILMAVVRAMLQHREALAGIVGRRNRHGPQRRPGRDRRGHRPGRIHGR